MPGYLEMLEWSEVVYRELSKGTKTLPWRMPNSDSTSCDLNLEAATV